MESWLEISLIFGWIAAALGFAWYWNRRNASRIGETVGALLRSMDEKLAARLERRKQSGAPEREEAFVQECWGILAPDVEAVANAINATRTVDIRLVYVSPYFASVAAGVESLFARRGYGRRYALEERDRGALRKAAKDSIRAAARSSGGALPATL